MLRTLTLPRLKVGLDARAIARLWWLACAAVFTIYLGGIFLSLDYDLPEPRVAVLNGDTIFPARPQPGLIPWNLLQDEKLVIAHPRSLWLENTAGLNQFVSHNYYYSLLGNVLPLAGLSVGGLSLWGWRLPQVLLNLIPFLLLGMLVYRSRSLLALALLTLCLFDYDYFYIQRLGILDLSFGAILIGLYLVWERDPSLNRPLSKAVQYLLGALLFVKSLMFIYALFLFTGFLLTRGNKREKAQAVLRVVIGTVLAYAAGAGIYTLFLPPEYRYGYLAYHLQAAKHLAGAASAHIYQKHALVGLWTSWYAIVGLFRAFPFTLLLAALALYKLAFERRRVVTPNFLAVGIFGLLFLALSSTQLFYLKRVGAITSFLVFLFFQYFLNGAARSKLYWTGLTILVLGFFALQSARYSTTFSALASTGMHLTLQQDISRDLDERLAAREPGAGLINVVTHCSGLRFFSLSQRARFFSGDDQHVGGPELLSFAQRHRVKYLLFPVAMPEEHAARIRADYGIVGWQLIQKYDLSALPDAVAAQNTYLYELKYDEPANVHEPIAEPVAINMLQKKFEF